ADTFSKEGGTPYFEQAQSIVNLSQSSGFSGWKQTDGNRTRWELVDNLLSNTFKEYRMALYNYHRQGMDVLVSDPKGAKEQILSSMSLRENLHNTRRNSYVLQAYFDAKSEELTNIFPSGPNVKIAELKENLNSMAPLYSKPWSPIKY